MEQKKTCDSCSKTFEEPVACPGYISVYCTECGEKQAPFCPGCGCVMPKEGQYCQNCRRRRKEIAEEVKSKRSKKRKHH